MMNLVQSSGYDMLLPALEKRWKDRLQAVMREPTASRSPKSENILTNARLAVDERAVSCDPRA